MPILFHIVSALYGLYLMMGCTFPGGPDGPPNAHLKVYLEIGVDIPNKANLALQEHCLYIIEGIRRKFYPAGITVQFADAKTLTKGDRDFMREANRIRPNRKVVVTITGKRMPDFVEKRGLFGGTTRDGQIAVFALRFPPDGTVDQFRHWITEVAAHEIGHALNLRVRFDLFSYFYKAATTRYEFELGILPEPNLMSEGASLSDNVCFYDTGDAHNSRMFAILRTRDASVQTLR